MSSDSGKFKNEQQIQDLKAIPEKSETIGGIWIGKKGEIEIE